jgi:glycosyltransferase involved in cell wall biosynthesis
MKPTVTIGMCLRNCQNLLGDAIESIIDQDFQHSLIEIIFVDDGSEDHTVEIIKMYISKMDIKSKLFQTKWGGLGSARNLIVNNAEGDYIIWVDCDEILSKDYVRRQVDFMNQNPDVGITSGVVRTIPGNLVLNLELIPGIVDHMQYGKPRTFIWKTVKLPGTGGATYRTKAVRSINGFDEKLKGVGEDQDAARRIKDSGWQICLNNSNFIEKHGGMSTPKDLMKKYFWYGRGNQQLYRKNKRLFSLLRMSPPAGFLTGFFYSLIAYRLLHEKKVFLLPIHFELKMAAWTLGFIKGQINAGGRREIS